MDTETAEEYAEFLRKIGATGFAVTIEVNGSRRPQYETRVSKAQKSQHGLERVVSEKGIKAEILNAVAHVNGCYNIQGVNDTEPDENYDGVDFALHVPLNDERLLRCSLWRTLYHPSPSEPSKRYIQQALGLNSGFRFESLMAGFTSDSKMLFRTRAQYEAWKTDVIGLVAEYFMFQAFRDSIKGLSKLEKAMLHRLPVYRQGSIGGRTLRETDTDADVIVVCPKERFFEALWDTCEQYGWKERYFNNNLL